MLLTIANANQGSNSVSIMGLFSASVYVSRNDKQAFAPSLKVKIHNLTNPQVAERLGDERANQQIGVLEQHGSITGVEEHEDQQHRRRQAQKDDRLEAPFSGQYA